VGEKIYKDLQESGIDVIWDDRKASPGVKLKDADLVGIPYQVIIGSRGLKNKEVEFKIRKTGEKSFVPIGEISKKVIESIQREKSELMSQANQYV